MADEDVKDSKIVARIEVEMKFNTGNYESETYKIAVEGPYNDIKDGKDLVRLLYPTIRNAKVTIKKAKDGASLEEVLPKEEKKEIPPPGKEIAVVPKKDAVAKKETKNDDIQQNSVGVNFAPTDALIGESMLIIGDFHLDARLGTMHTIDLINEKIDKIIELANQELGWVVFLGDYFNPANPDNEYREMLSNIICKIKTKKIFLIGNHDKDKTGKNCLGAIKPFISENNGMVVEDCFEDGDYCFISYTLDFQHIEDIINKTKCKYIVGHFAFDYEVHGRIFKGELEYKPQYDSKVFVLGHIHKHQYCKPNVLYLGSIAPHKLDELDYNYKILQIDDKGEFNFKNIKYNLKQKNITDISQLDGDDENTKVVMQVDSVEEKNRIMAQLGDRKFLDLKIEVKNKSIDISGLNIQTMVKEYLKIMGRDDLFELVMKFIDKKDVENVDNI